MIMASAGCTPLALAANFAARDSLKALLAAHADPNIPTGPIAMPRGRRGQAVISRQGMIEADEYHQDGVHWSALHLASRVGDAVITKLLLQHGAVVNARATGPKGAWVGTPLHNAKPGSAVPFVLLKHGANLLLQDADLKAAGAGLSASQLSAWVWQLANGRTTMLLCNRKAVPHVVATLLLGFVVGFNLAVHFKQAAVSDFAEPNLNLDTKRAAAVALMHRVEALFHQAPNTAGQQGKSQERPDPESGQEVEAELACFDFAGFPGVAMKTAATHAGSHSSDA